MNYRILLKQNIILIYFHILFHHFKSNTYNIHQVLPLERKILYTKLLTPIN